MTDLMVKALECVRKWPIERQTEAAELLLALDALGGTPVELSADELRAIDEALAEVDRGEFADPRDVEAVFERFRK